MSQRIILKVLIKKNSLRITEYRKNPIDYCCKWSLPSKQVEKETKLQRLIEAYKKDQISLFDYLNALASNIEVTQYIDDDDFEKEEENNVLNARRSAESLPKI